MNLSYRWLWALILPWLLMTEAGARVANCPTFVEASGRGGRTGRVTRRAGNTREARPPRTTVTPVVEVAAPVEAPFVETRTNIDELKELRVVGYNVLNLFHFVGSFKHEPGSGNRRVPQGSGPTDKPESEREGVAKAIRDLDPDVLVMTEVENLETMQQFSKTYLHDRYESYLIEGNDARGIDVGFYVRRSLKLHVEHRTNKEEVWNDPTEGNAEGAVFSRDLPVLILRKKAGDYPLLILAGTHYKSKRDRDGDPQSRIHRAAQVAATSRIFSKIYEEFGKDAPLAMAGDFNGSVNEEPEFRSLFLQSKLKDAFDLVRPALSERDRITHTYHPREMPAERHQIDAVLLAPWLQQFVRTGRVYRYLGRGGAPLPIPETFDERKRNPSDHFPVYVELDLERMRQGR